MLFTSVLGVEYASLTFFSFPGSLFTVYHNFMGLIWSLIFCEVHGKYFTRSFMDSQNTQDGHIVVHCLLKTYSHCPCPPYCPQLLSISPDFLKYLN